ncbi:hypothetical protein [Arthrobacter sp. A5]|uniref:hypothetical protein n=1 Tax=Arthrobacter sp. A5 TaxID=576926 RepID=UPI003DA8D5EE
MTLTVGVGVAVGIAVRVGVGVADVVGFSVEPAALVAGVDGDIMDERTMPSTKTAKLTPIAPAAILRFARPSQDRRLKRREYRAVRMAPTANRIKPTPK